MKPKIALIESVPEAVKAYLEAHFDVKQWHGQGRIDKETLYTLIEDCEGCLLAGVHIHEDFLDHAKAMRIVSNISVGYNNLNLNVMKERGVFGTHTPYVLDDSVADLILGMMISVARRLPELDRKVKSGMWGTVDPLDWFGLEMHHKKLGIIGMGRIGEAVAKRAKFGFDMKVSYFNRSPKLEVEEHLGVTYEPLHDLLATSDFVLLMTPLTPQTEKLMDATAFESMKDTAFFINASRGKTVDEEALIEALKHKKIAGAALDVFEQEPVAKDNPLLAMDNVVTLPHIGSASLETREAMAKVAADNLVHFFYKNGPVHYVPELKPEHGKA